MKITVNTLGEFSSEAIRFAGSGAKVEVRAEEKFVADDDNVRRDVYFRATALIIDETGTGLILAMEFVELVGTDTGNKNQAELAAAERTNELRESLESVGIPVHPGRFEL